MNPREALELLGDAIPANDRTWADIGAGDGTFTRALAERLGPRSRIYAVDLDARALAALERWATSSAANVIAIRGDFTQPFALPGVMEGQLDGLLLANALHFVRDPGAVLARLVRWLRPSGRAVLVEYDHRRANPWVPYPIASARLPELAAAAGLSTPVVTATRPSAYGGDLYVAVADRLPGRLGTRPPG